MTEKDLALCEAQLTVSHTSESLERFQKENHELHGQVLSLGSLATTVNVDESKGLYEHRISSLEGEIRKLKGLDSADHKVSPIIVCSY